MKKRTLAELLGLDSPLDMPMTLTRFPNQAAFRKETWTCTPREFAREFSKTIADNKKDLPWFSGNTYGNAKSRGNSLRNNAHVIDVNAIVVDYDGEETSLQAAARIAEEAKVAGVFYPSASYTREKPRWRGVFPLSKSHRPEDRDRLVARVNGLYSGTLDQQASFTLSQGFYYGKLAGRDIPDPILADGCHLDLAPNLDKRALGKRTRETDGERESDQSRSGAAFRKAVSLHLNGGTIEDFEAWAVENSWSDYERDPERAIERTWEQAAIEAGKIALAERVGACDFDNLGEPAKSRESGITITRASDIEPKQVNWLWLNHIAMGKGTLLTGNPGVSKSTMAADIAATIARGSKWHDGSRAPKGNVLFLSSEDAAEDTMIPRIIAAGGDRDRIGIVRQTVGDKNRRRMINLKDDLARLAKAIRDFGEVRLVIIDPITAYMGSGVDSHKATDVRAVLDGVSEWAQELDLAVLAITHPAKAVTSAMNAAVGSQAYVAFFRATFLAGYHPEDADLPDADKRRVLSCIKLNIGPKPSSVVYRVVSEEIGNGISSPRIEWGESIILNADELVKPEAAEKKADAAKKFLQEQFATEKIIAAATIQSAADKARIAWRTVERSKRELGIRSFQEDGQWWWQWPG